MLPYHLRAAELRDLEQIASLLIKCMPLDPQWAYRFPHRDQYPEEHRRLTLKRVVEYWDNVASSGCVMTVVEIVEPEKEAETSEREANRNIVGAAICQMPVTFLMGSEESSTPAFDMSPPDFQRPDADEARLRLSHARFKAARREYFDGVYGNNQVYVHFLVVHPEHQRRGLGNMLLRAVLDAAKQDGRAKAVTLTASPIGEALYRKLGFEEVAKVHFRVEGDSLPGAEGVSGALMVCGIEHPQLIRF